MQTGNEIVDKTSTLQIGYQNSNWYKVIRSDKGNTNFLAVSMLQDFIYWYKWTEIRDETTGSVVEYKKKFKDTMYLQKNYPQLEEEFLSTKKQIYDALVILENKELIKRHFKNVTINNITYRNIMYIEIFPENIYKMTYNTDVPTYKYTRDDSKVTTTVPICPTPIYLQHIPTTDTNHTDEVDTSSDSGEKNTETEHDKDTDITHTTASKQSCNKNKSEQEESRTTQIVMETYSEYRKRCPNMPECNITDSLCRCVIGTIRRYSGDKIRECLDTAGKSSWLNSHTTNFVCDFKWIFRNSAKGTPTNVDKILEGYYNRQTKGMAFQEGQQDYSDTTSWRNMDKPKAYDN